MSFGSKQRLQQLLSAVVAGALLTAFGCSSRTDAEMMRDRLRELIVIAMEQQKPDIPDTERDLLVNKELEKYYSVVKESVPWSPMLDEADRPPLTDEQAKFVREMNEQNKDKSPKEIVQDIRKTAMEMDLKLPGFALVIFKRLDDGKEVTEQEAELLSTILLAELLSGLS